MEGSALLVGAGQPDNIPASFVGLRYRGLRRTDLESEYLEEYHVIDERGPRLRQLPDSKVERIRDLYTAEELKNSPVFNEAFLRGRLQGGLNVRMDGPDGSNIIWVLCDPVGRQGWESSHITLVRKLLPHLRQFVFVRQTLVRARALETSAVALLDSQRLGVIHLDRQRRVLATNDRERHKLRHTDGLSDRGEHGHHS